MSLTEKIQKYYEWFKLVNEDELDISNVVDKSLPECTEKVLGDIIQAYDTHFTREVLVYNDRQLAELYDNFKPCPLNFSERLMLHSLIANHAKYCLRCRVIMIEELMTIEEWKRISKNHKIFWNGKKLSKD